MDSWKIFKKGLSLGKKITSTIGKEAKVAKDNVQKMIDAKRYRDSLEYAKALTEPSRTLVIIEISKAWRKNPELKFTNDVIEAVNMTTEPQRTGELTSLMAFCASKKISSAVQKISSLL
jgi:hypothetical protein